MQPPTRADTRWGIQTGLTIGLAYGVIALLGYWISPSDYARRVPVSAPLTLVIFVAVGIIVGLALAELRHVHATRPTGAGAAFIAGLAFSASALAASHGRAYLLRGAHWLVIVGIALAAPSIASTFWPDRD